MAKALNVRTVEVSEAGYRAAGDPGWPPARAVFGRPAIRGKVLGGALPTSWPAMQAHPRPLPCHRSRKRPQIGGAALRAVAEGRNPGREKKHARRRQG